MRCILIRVLLVLVLASAAPHASAAGKQVAPHLTAPDWLSGTYSYDGAGNITQIGPSNENKSSMFSYDLACRLKGPFRFA